MKVGKRTISTRAALGCLTLASVVVSTVVVFNRGPYEAFQLALLTTSNDGAKYALAVKYPAIREDLLAGEGVKDLASLRARVDDDIRTLNDARVHWYHRSLVDWATMSGALTIFFLAGVSLLRTGRGSRSSTPAISI